MYCSKCGNNVGDNAKFCNKCGNQISYDNTNQTDIINDKLSEDKNSPNKKIILIISVVVALVIGLSLTLYTLKNKQNNDSQSQISSQEDNQEQDSQNQENDQYQEDTQNQDEYSQSAFDLYGQTVTETELDSYVRHYITDFRDGNYETMKDYISDSSYYTKDEIIYAIPGMKEVIDGEKYLDNDKVYLDYVEDSFAWEDSNLVVIDCIVTIPAYDPLDIVIVPIKTKCRFEFSLDSSKDLMIHNIIPIEYVE